MNIEEYKFKLKLINDGAEEKRNYLTQNFAISNKTLNIGDFAKDSNGTILVEKIRIGKRFNSDVPECIYYGPNLTKELKQKKRYSKRDVYQSLLIE